MVELEKNKDKIYKYDIMIPPGDNTLYNTSKIIHNLITLIN